MLQRLWHRRLPLILILIWQWSLMAPFPVCLPAQMAGNLPCRQCYAPCRNLDGVRFPQDICHCHASCALLVQCWLKLGISWNCPAERHDGTCRDRQGPQTQTLRTIAGGMRLLFQFPRADQLPVHGSAEALQGRCSSHLSLAMGFVGGHAPGDTL